MEVKFIYFKHHLFELHNYFLIIIFFVFFFQVLLVQQETCGKLGFPKGTPFLQESYEACVAREVREETGLDIKEKISWSSSIFGMAFNNCFPIENCDLNFFPYNFRFCMKNCDLFISSLFDFTIESKVALIRQCPLGSVEDT
jgi:8-oxo-dGTP pyrophosphatase MutT (NUDIX family)